MRDGCTIVRLQWKQAGCFSRQAPHGLNGFGQLWYHANSHVSFLFNFVKSCFSLFLIFGPDIVHPDANMSNDCLFVELKEVVNYTVSFFLQKIDELRLCLDVVLRNKTPVNHTPSGVFTICLPTNSLFLLIKTDVLHIVHPYIAYSVAAFDAVWSKNVHLNLLKKKV